MTGTLPFTPQPPGTGANHSKEMHLPPEVEGDQKTCINQFPKVRQRGIAPGNNQRFALEEVSLKQVVLQISLHIIGFMEISFEKGKGQNHRAET